MEAEQKELLERENRALASERKIIEEKLVLLQNQYQQIFASNSSARIVVEKEREMNRSLDLQVFSLLSLSFINIILSFFIFFSHLYRH